MAVQEFPCGPGGEGAEDGCEADGEQGEQEMFTLRRTREDAVDQSVKERRRELVNRFYLAQAGGQLTGSTAEPGQPAPHLARRFSRVDAAAAEGTRFDYEWWSEQRADEAGILELERRAEVLKQEPSSVAGSALAPFRQLLEDHQIDVDAFGVGKAKTLEQLAAEVREGVCRLMLDATEHKKLVRVVDFVGVRLFSRPGSFWSRQRLLVETEERYPDGRRREIVRLPGTKKRPHENARQTAARIVKETLMMASDGVEFDLSSIVRFEREFESPSYPGVRTVYRKEIVEGFVCTSNAAQLAQVGLPNFGTWSSTGPDGNTKFFSWMTEAAAKAKEVEMKADTASSVSPLVRAPVGLSEDALRTQLASTGIDVASFGQCRRAPKLIVRTLSKALGLSEDLLDSQLSSLGIAGRARTLREFSAELVRGEASLALGPNGGALRVVDIVLVALRRPGTRDLLVQTARREPTGQRTPLNRLPGAKCRPDEHHFLGARRILRKQLGIDESEVVFDSEVRAVQEQGYSSDYPGLETVLRKRLIFAQLRPSGSVSKAGGCS